MLVNVVGESSKHQDMLKENPAEKVLEGPKIGVINNV